MSETGLNEEVVAATPVLAGDLTRGPILSTLIRFALPTLGSNLLLATAAYGAVLQLWNYISMPAFALSTSIASGKSPGRGAR